MLELESLRGRCKDIHPRTRQQIISVEDWTPGDIEGTFDYTVKHDYLKNHAKIIVAGYGYILRSF